MRPLPLAVCLLCIVFIAVLAGKLRRSPVSNPDPSTEESQSEDLGDADEVSKEPTAAKRPGTREIPPQWITEAWTWHFSEEQKRFFDREPKLSRSGARIAAEWRLRFLVWQQSQAIHPPIPEQVSKIRLVNGKTLWARTSRSTERGITIELLSTIETTLRRTDVGQVRTVPRADYLRETQGDFEELVAGQEPTSLVPLAHALARGDGARASDLFDAWLEVGGPWGLAKKLPIESRILARQAATLLGSPREVVADTTTTASVGDDPSTTGATARKRKPKFNKPATVEDLLKRIDSMRRRVGRTLTADQRELCLAELSTWEEWLEFSGSGQSIPEDSQSELRKQMQFLRLDLVKSSGF